MLGPGRSRVDVVGCHCFYFVCSWVYYSFGAPCVGLYTRRTRLVIGRHHSVTNTLSSVATMFYNNWTIHTGFYLDAFQGEIPLHKNIKFR